MCNQYAEAYNTVHTVFLGTPCWVPCKEKYKEVTGLLCGPRSVSLDVLEQMCFYNEHQVNSIIPDVADSSFHDVQMCI